MYRSLKKDIFDYLYSNVDGYKISDLAKRGLGTFDRTLTYGEIEFDSFIDILDDLPYTPNHRIFYDLGSGTGKAVMVAALDGEFERLVGVEIIPELYEVSLEILNRYNQQIIDKYPDKAKVQIDFHCQDLFDFDCSDGDVVFVQTTCMNDDLMQKIENKLLYLKPGSLVITISYSLTGPFFLINYKKYKMSWGEATVFFHVLK